MTSRLILLVLAGLCVTLNVLVWRAEYGSKDNETPVPDALVWRKIMTAPESSSLNIFQAGKRTGFCEISTGVGQEMAQLDDNRPPPEGLATRVNYQVHFNGNASFGDFTNRVKFEGHVFFNARHAWQSLDLRVLMRNLTLQLDSAATNQTVHVSLTSDGATIHRTFTFADLNDPNKILRSVLGDFAGNFGGLLLGLELPGLPNAASAAGGVQWDAVRTRVMFGHEPVPVYRLETRVLDHPVVILTSTLGEILRVELPGDFEASLDEWGKP
jgi:hypothetical protein